MYTRSQQWQHLRYVLLSRGVRRNVSRKLRVTACRSGTELSSHPITTVRQQSIDTMELQAEGGLEPEDPVSWTQFLVYMWTITVRA